MSWEAENWARQQRTGDPVTKAVLVGIANWMNPKGDLCQVSLRRLADEVEISVRTAQRHIQRLEGLGLVLKSAVKRDDGGTGWNGFEFPTYKPPKVSHVEPAGTQAKPHDKLSRGEGDNLAWGESLNSSAEAPCQIDAPTRQSDLGRVTQLRHREGDNRVTPERGKGVYNTPPTPPAGGRDDADKKIRVSRIPEDWTAPPIDELPPAAKAKARQWPAGAYEAEAEAFRDYWLGEGRPGSRKLDWKRTWCNRINEITARVLRDAKAGVRFAASPRPAGETRPIRALDTSREGEAARKIRDQIRRRIGEQVYDRWIVPARLDVDGGTLTVVSSGSFASSYQRDTFGHDIGQAMHAVLGPDADLRFRTEGSSS